MSNTNRADARMRGLRLAAKVATLGGVAVAVLGLVEAKKASASEAVKAPSHEIAADDPATPLPGDGLMKVAKGGCGCAPCWGPPAPPEKTRRRAKRRRASKRGRR